MSNALKQLFAILLIYCEPTNVLQLWNEYYMDLSHDYQTIKDISYDDCVSKILLDINLFLERMGRSIDDFDLPELPHVQEIFHDLNDELNNREISEELNVITPAEDINIIHTLNSSQKNAFEEIINRVNQKHHGMFFIDGPGGTGKTYLYRAILSTLRNEGHITITTATSGVAASILPGGRTTHSRFKIPINSTEITLCAITKQSGLAQLLKKTSIILWDEAPMVKRTAIETLDRTMKDIMNSSISFGGKVIVFRGDF
ncbi:ATP-dependent DNA helicase PIF1-like [Dendrobium catenatum]|uniref:ATP-dependent DNA helicase PIF1-like n=1 Tax=Dendrobium catenatum TaxID=906689 RepID=UPI0010A088AF|nr:ATP-dependent DNA helicase PIF1-like [Dendrobium catenatum]